MCDLNACIRNILRLMEERGSWDWRSSSKTYGGVIYSGCFLVKGLKANSSSLSVCGLECRQELQKQLLPISNEIRDRSPPSALSGMSYACLCSWKHTLTSWGGVSLCCSFTQSGFRQLLAHVHWGRGSRMLCNRMESQELMLIFGKLFPLLCVPNSCLPGQMSKLQLSSEMHVYVFICMHTYVLVCVATKGQCQVLSLFLSILYLT